MRVGNGRVKRAMYPPGFRWSTHMGPNVDSDLCMHAHIGFLAQGHIQGEYTDGCTFEYVAPQVVTIEPGHDAWVVGDEAAVLIQFDSEEGTARRFGLPARALALGERVRVPDRLRLGLPWTYVFLFVIARMDVSSRSFPARRRSSSPAFSPPRATLYLVLVILFAAGGAILGDNVPYWIGRKTGHRIVNRFFKGERRKQIDWAHRQVQERGGYLIIVGRFIPAGRTAVTLSCGMLEMPWRRFIAFDVAAGLVWATYAAMLGYVGGRTFEENPLYGFLLAFAVALAVTGLVEAYRWLRKRGVLARG